MWNRILFHFVVNIILCVALDISSKLDFENSKSPSKLIETLTKYKPTSFRSHNDESDNSDSELENIGVVSVPVEICNGTEQKKFKDSIQTDVVIHIKTNVDLNNTKKSIFVSDTSSDVPVIVGSRVNNFNDNPNIIRPLTVTKNIQQPYVPTNTPYGSDIYRQRTNYRSGEQQINLNVEPLPLRKTKERNAAPMERKANTLEFYLPHLESSYHRHYFGENPPPQLIWYPKTTENQLKSTAQPSFWPTIAITPTTEKNRFVPENTCLCKNDIPTGPQWYSAARLDGSDPGGQISDKLSHLD